MSNKSALKKSLTDYAFAVFILFCMAAILFFKSAAASFTEGIKLWFACILPSLFPYMFFSAMLSETKAAHKIAARLSPLSEKIFNVNGCVLYAFFLSLISGYPIGAKTVSDLSKNGAIGKSETVRAATLCSTASPVFLIVSIGSIAFNSVFFGVLLFTTHLISAIISGVIFSFYRRKDRPEKPSPVLFSRSTNLLYESAEKSAVGVITVGGIIAVFYTFTDILFSSGVLSPAASGLTGLFGDENIGNGVAFSLFECTKGLKTISLSGINFFTLPLCAAVCGFGGVSVIAQSMAFLKSAKIKTAVFISIKLFAAAINFVIGLLVSLLFFL